jgi:hypothetical protein
MTIWGMEESFSGSKPTSGDENRRTAASGTFLKKGTDFPFSELEGMMGTQSEYNATFARRLAGVWSFHQAGPKENLPSQTCVNGLKWLPASCPLPGYVRTRSGR